MIKPEELLEEFIGQYGHELEQLNLKKLQIEAMFYFSAAFMNRKQIEYLNQNKQGLDGLFGIQDGEQHEDN